MNSPGNWHTMKDCAVRVMVIRDFTAFSQTKAGETLVGKTATNAACAYSFLNYRNAPRKVTYHITRNGNIIFDFITILAEKELAK